MKWLILLAGIGSSAAASVLLKIAILPPRRFPSLGDPIEALSNWPFWLGLASYGLAYILYVAALGRFPMNIAQPILTSGAIAVVSVCSVIFFQESFGLTSLLGILLIMGGVFLITIQR